MKCTLVLFCLVALHITALAQLPDSRQIREMIGVGWDESRGDTVVYDRKEYSPEGWLLVDAQPIYYCDVTRQYDSLGRVTEQDGMCGESSANGTTTYRYEGNLVYVEADLSGLSESGVLKLDERERPVWEQSTIKDFFGNHIEQHVTTTQFGYKGDLLVEQVVRSTIFSFEGESQLDADVEIVEQSRYTTLYSYNQQDSLIEKLTIDSVSGDTTTRTLNEYDQDAHLKTAQKQYWGGRLTTQRFWSYDANGNVLQEESRTFAYGSLDEYTTTDTFYEYKDGLLVRIRVEPREKGRSSGSESTFENGLLKRITYFDEHGAPMEKVIYRYTWW